MDPSTFFYDSASSDEGNSGSTLTQSILNSVTQLGTAAIVSTQSPNVYSPYPPPTSTRGLFTSSGPYVSNTQSSGMFWLVLAVIAVFSFIYLPKLAK